MPPRPGDPRCFGYSARVLRSWILALVAVSGLAGSLARAQELECPRPEVGPLETTPSSGAEGVKVDSFIKVRFSADYFVGVDFGETLVGLYENLADTRGFVELGDPVAGTGQVVGDDVFFLPAETLRPNQRYAIVAEDLDALTSLQADFETGVSFDSGPPRLGSVSAPSTEKVGATCESEGGYRVDLLLAGVTEDGPTSSVELLVYLARQEDLEAPELVLRERASSNDEIPLGFVLSEERTHDPACVVIHAVDGVGNVDDDMEPVCFEPIQGAFFNGLCSASGVAGQDRPSGALGLGILGALVVLVRRRRRARSTC